MHPLRLLTLSVCIAAASAAGTAHAQLDTPKVTIAAGDGWNRLKGPLRDAIECKAPLKATPAVRGVLHAKDNLTGDYTLPEPLTVFGTIKVTAVSVFDEGDDGAGFTIMPAGLKLAEMAKAAGLKKEKGSGRYIRTVKGGHIEADEAIRGEPKIACILGDGSNND